MRAAHLVPEATGVRHRLITLLLEAVQRPLLLGSKTLPPLAVPRSRTLRVLHLVLLLVQCCIFRLELPLQPLLRGLRILDLRVHSTSFRRT